MLPSNRQAGRRTTHLYAVSCIYFEEQTWGNEQAIGSGPTRTLATESLCPSADGREG